MAFSDEPVLNDDASINNLSGNDTSYKSKLKITGKIPAILTKGVKIAVEKYYTSCELRVPSPNIQVMS